MLKDKNFENFLNDKITDYTQISRYAGKRDITQGKTLDNLAGISVGIASKEEIRSLSYGEVLISETINYRTQRPERGGLFCEQIFGPRKNYECACGKYKRLKYKGVVCERCGVEVTTSQVRRQRTGHIEFAAPIVHIWYLKSVPSRIGLLLDISVKKLEQVVYFASYIITEVNEEKRIEALKELENVYKSSKVDLQRQCQQAVTDAKTRLDNKEISKKEYQDIEGDCLSRLDKLEEEYGKIKGLLKEMRVSVVVGELDYRVLYDKFPHVFKGGTGAEHIKTLLERIDIKKFIADNQRELKNASKSKQKKILQKLKLASSLFKSNQRPEHFILEALQILPPDLRPMIQLDGGRYASSDLNDLYRRVINRNNRLRKLSELGAPEVILKNEKRMLQEAVDMLINGDVRSNRPGYTTATRKKLKSLAEILKGKQGRFRQNLLGKRVDYSGRSVIVVGPSLKMNECGLPKTMALTLFRPFVIGRLIEKEIVFNVKHAEKIIEEQSKEVWDTLDEVIQGKYVLLNRAPTLHRLGIQAFRPVLIDGKAIQLHPLCCTAFNADFDGDQMAVHVPLTHEAQAEAQELMVTSRNMLYPSNGEPIIAPSQDMILGCYYLTKIADEEQKFAFASLEDATPAYENNIIKLHTPIKIRRNGELLDTTYGRMLFNQIVPTELGYVNETLGKHGLKRLLARSFLLLGSEETAFFADRIKNTGFKYATISGITFSKDDMIIPDTKGTFVEEGEEKIKLIQKKFWNGFLTEKERYSQSVRVWNQVKAAVEKDVKKSFDSNNNIFNMVDSGARGNWGQTTQLCGMKGLVASPSGKIIELPIKANYKEGLSVLEYFINTHSGRKGKSDTALKTSQSGYLTRRLVDASQSILVREEDCKTLQYKEVTRGSEKQVFAESFEERLYGKYIAQDISVDGKVIYPEGTLIDKQILEDINEKQVDIVRIRSILTCETEGGLCQKCYGLDLGYNSEVKMGTPVGVVAAQSIGEPGTQLTMNTFHQGGIAKEEGDITQGLVRVDELFEARMPKNQAVIADLGGMVMEAVPVNFKDGVPVVEETPELRTELSGIHLESSRTVKKENKNSFFDAITYDYDENSEGKMILRVPRVSLSLGQFVYTDFGGNSEGGARQKSCQTFMIILKAKEPQTYDHYYQTQDNVYKILIKKGEKVKVGAVLARSEKYKNDKILSHLEGIVEEVEEGVITVREERAKVLVYFVQPGRTILPKKGGIINLGDKITEGHINVQKLMELAGVIKTQEYIVREIKAIYSSQGQNVNSKHIELIVRQMFSKIKITNAGDSIFFPGDIVDMVTYKKENDKLAVDGLRQAIGTRLLLGLTKISLFTESWLSAASFQETVRVLVEASVGKKIDKLEGLKENVIIGRLIPTLKYFNNNQNVGSYFDGSFESEDEINLQGNYEREVSTQDSASLN